MEAREIRCEHGKCRRDHQVAMAPIIVHGLESYGMAWISGAIHRSAELAAHALPVAAGVAEWLINAIGSGIVGLTIGSVLGFGPINLLPSRIVS